MLVEIGAVAVVVATAGTELARGWLAVKVARPRAQVARTAVFWGIVRRA